MIAFLTKTYRRFSNGISVASYYAVPKMFVFGAIATAGFPLYYYVWAYLFPQPYEDLGLRLVFSALAAPLLFTNFWPGWTRPIIPLYWFAVLTLCLPFFFTYMLLHNGVDSIWPMASVAAVLLVFLIVDTLTAIIMTVVGATAGILIFTLGEGNTLYWADFQELLPVYAFTLVTGIAFNLGNEREQRARSLAARALGGHVAHELGNPLTAVRVGAKEIKEHVPDLVETYHAAKRAGLDVATISENQLQFLSRAGEMTEVEANYALMVIDMMLKKAGESSASAYEQERLSILGCVHRAIDQYAFKSRGEKYCVSVAEAPDFVVYANETLVRHLVFNLMQNGLYAIKAARRRDAGTIQVWAVPGHRVNRLHFRDNGIGMSRETLARVFDPFFTTREQGTGLGLHFCRDVMRRFGGDISCESSPGYFTEIVLVFPATRPSTVSIPTLTQEPGRNGESEDQEHPGWNGESSARPRVLS